MYVCRGCGIPGPTYEKEQVVHLDDGSFACQKHAFERATKLAHEAKRICDEANAIVPSY
jgi:hypothetical protein